MIYNDGVELDKNMTVTICPRCENEQFVHNSNHCRICGLSARNTCEGYYDEMIEAYIVHNCSGNARFCEYCGKATIFYNESILKEWSEAKKHIEITKDLLGEITVAITTDVDDEELPF